MNSSLALVRLFSLLLVACLIIFLFPNEILAETNEYVFRLNSKKIDNGLSDKLFREEVTNAYPGMALPIRKIYIINEYKESISVRFNMDFLEPKIDWIEGQVFYEQAGNKQSILLDTKKRNFEDKKISLDPGETVYLEVQYLLKGENIINLHQNQPFTLKWKLIGDIQEESDSWLPSTNEKARKYHLWGILLVSSILIYVFYKKIYNVQGGKDK